MFQTKECLVNTQDDWSPNFPNDQVLVFISKLKTKNITYRVGVWGMDDLGMDIDFENNNPSEAIKLYEKLSKKDFINKDYLKSIGFNYF